MTSFAKLWNPGPIIPSVNENGPASIPIKNGAAIGETIGIPISTKAGEYLCNSTVYKCVAPKIVGGVFGPNADADGDGIKNGEDPDPFGPRK